CEAREPGGVTSRSFDAAGRKHLRFDCARRAAGDARRGGEEIAGATRVFAVPETWRRGRLRRRRRLLARTGNHIPPGTVQILVERDLAHGAIVTEHQLDKDSNRASTEGCGAIPLEVVPTAAAPEREPAPAVVAFSGRAV